MFRILCILFLVLMHGYCDAADDTWFVGIYGGQYSDTALNEIVRLGTDFQDSYVYVLSVGKQLGVYKETIGYELEGQVGVHSGEQDHAEANCAFTLRWLPFVWDKYLDTSFAFGNGVSYASADPPLEARESDDQRTNQWLYYISVELAFALPKVPQWETFVRIHHRSSVFGLIGGISSGSNFVGCGLRYHF
jgi:hypothetical protein